MPRKREDSHHPLHPAHSGRSKESYKAAVLRMCGYIARESTKLEKTCTLADEMRGDTKARAMCRDMAFNARWDAEQCVKAAKKGNGSSAVSFLSIAAREHEEAKIHRMKMRPDPRGRR